MSEKFDFIFPIGYFNFHKKQVYNFQFNRWHSLGFARYEDMMEAGKRINNFSDWKSVMIDLAEKAESEGRLKNAMIYYRGAEFYITQKDPDKIKIYNKFIDMFYESFESYGLKRFKVPYDNSYLPAFRIPVFDGKKKGIILMHGGFDSFIEEFYPMMRFFSNNGYEVVAFEGPGQGGARRKYDLGWDDKWDKPTKAVLDFFKLDDVTIFGISMGGYLCLRAAAFDDRIKRVVTSGGAVDYWRIMGPFSRGLLKFFLKFENFTTKSMVKKMKKDEHHNWFAENSMYITKIDNPLKASLRMLDMNEGNLHADNITQDVLVLSGKNDHFIPIKMHKIIIDTLKNAHSVEGIVYSKETNANNHCQIGNISLVCNDVINWLNKKN